jgi:solute carrier family 6 (neurotransmitter transporter)
MVSSTGSSSIPDVINTINDIRPRFTSVNGTSSGTEEDERAENEHGSESKQTWPHSISRPITCLFCTLGLFNISRFAIFSVHFGGEWNRSTVKSFCVLITHTFVLFSTANFLLQFLLLSVIFGIPFLWLQIVLGSKIRGGIVTMFKITPICKGIGISLMVTHCIISLYSSIGIAWVLIYLK